MLDISTKTTHKQQVIQDLRLMNDGADSGTRTRGLNLGKVALYQLSYIRKQLTSISPLF